MIAHRQTIVPIPQAMGDIKMKKHYSIGQQFRTVMIFLFVVFQTHAQSRVPYKINSVKFSVATGTGMNGGDTYILFGAGDTAGMLPVNSVISAYNAYMAAYARNDAAACNRLGQGLRNACVEYSRQFYVTAVHRDANNKIVSVDLAASSNNAPFFGFASTTAINYVNSFAVGSTRDRAISDVAAVVADALKKNADWWLPCQQMMGSSQ